jgi:large subunit ribosomal protein L2
VPLKQYKATSPVRRFRQSASFEELTAKKAPERRLLERKLRSAGRNAQGRVTTRHRGGGEKRNYRKVDFKRDKDGVPARVSAIEYDPNRSARLALLVYRDGEKRYILAPNELKVGDTVLSGPDAEARAGNCLPLENIPTGSQIHGVELQPGRGAQLVRAAGGVAQLVAKEGEYAQIRLPSGGIRVVHVRCRATVGQLGNIDHENRKIGGAGHKRRMGWRPAVRGVVMSPRDHPHGGGEAKSPVGGMAQTPRGKPAMGLKTRRNPRTDRFVTERPHKRKAK